jgi:uncharacterized SAM-binding protein YcdF (DUF218 family)
MRSRATTTITVGALGGVVVLPVAVLVAACTRVILAERRAISGRGLGAGPLPCDPSSTLIVVFGAGAMPSGPSAELRARLDQAIALWRCGLAGRIAMTGGVARGVDEVDAMLQYAQKCRVPADALVPARPGQNTREQVASAVRLRDEGVVTTFIAVSSAFHVRRISDEARRNGLTMLTSAPASSPEARDRRLHAARIVADGIGTLWYALPPSWATRVRTSAGTLRHRGPLVAGGRLPVSALVARNAGDSPDVSGSTDAVESRGAPGVPHA